MVRDILDYVRTHYQRRIDYDPGLGLGSEEKEIRFLKPDGSPNVIRTGVPLRERLDFYYLMLNLTWTEFFAVVLSGFLVVNFAFAWVYVGIGTQQFSGLDSEEMGGKFWEIFYFSAQTLTTVGYGKISPVGHTVSAVAALEALIGLLGFALFTGLVYGRFSRPNFRLIFTPNILVAPYRGITALMFRVANPKINELIEAEALVMLTLVDPETQKRSYTSLTLERSKVMFFFLNWTIVHPIDESSPLVGLSHEELKLREPEILVVFKAFDEARSQNVYARTSYKAEQLVWGAKFAPIRVSKDAKGAMIHDLSNLNEFKEAELPY